jgi:hypothetical protein
LAGGFAGFFDFCAELKDAHANSIASSIMAEAIRASFEGVRGIKSIRCPIEHACPGDDFATGDAAVFESGLDLGYKKIEPDTSCLGRWFLSADDMAVPKVWI